MKFSAKASPAFNEYMFLNFVDENQIHTFYDIGVGPKSECNTIKDRHPHIEFFGIEANPKMYSQVKGRFPGEITNAAISQAGRGSQVAFHIHEENEMASGLVPYQDKPADQTIEPLMVPALSLDEYDQDSGMSLV